MDYIGQKTIWCHFASLKDCSFKDKSLLFHNTLEAAMPNVSHIAHQPENRSHSDLYAHKSAYSINGWMCVCVCVCVCVCMYVCVCVCVCVKVGSQCKKSQ